MYESRAIGRYLEEKYPNQGTKLIPTEIKAHALFEQAASVETSNFDAFASYAIGEVIFKPWVFPIMDHSKDIPSGLLRSHGLQTDTKKVEELTKNLSAKLDVYETILSKQKYLAGEVSVFTSISPLQILTTYNFKLDRK